MGRNARTDTKPVWKGPEVDGVTQSLLSRFLVCKERFRVLAIEGWAPHESFNAPIHYGQMWHVCEEALARDDGKGYLVNTIRSDLLEYCQQLCDEFPTEQSQVQKWYNVCLKQFPIYVKFWSKHPDVKQRTPLLQEQVFDVPYKLPSGRVVRLRGKWDSVDLIGKGKKAGIYLQENKTKGRIEEDYLTRQLTFDLQTMMYLIALQEYSKFLIKGGRVNRQPDYKKLPGNVLNFLANGSIQGVRYNVIRRPLSGGVGSIRPHKATKNKPAETEEEFYNRLRDDYFVVDPKYWFMRWKVDITEGDIQRFKDEFFDPCLEHLCLWYEFVTGTLSHRDDVMDLNMRMLHYRLPYGIFNPLLEGRGTDLEEYLLSGSTVGLRKVKTLFGELDG